MRFYSAGNMYLSSIQQGIQAAHCVGEMSKLILGNVMVSKWLHEHKTLICVNGGNNESLTQFYDLVKDNPWYPVAKFHEDEASMAGMLTSVGIIIPEKMYDLDINDPTTWNDLNQWEIAVATALKRMPLAR